MVERRQLHMYIRNFIFLFCLSLSPFPLFFAFFLGGDRPHRPPPPLATRLLQRKRVTHNSDFFTIYYRRSLFFIISTRIFLRCVDGVGKKEQFNISSSNAQLFNPRSNSYMIYWIFFFPPTFNMYWTLVPHARGRSREAVRLANFLIISCKHVIYNLYRTALFFDPLIVWVHRLKSRILFEFHYYKLCHNPYTFFRKWSVNDTLFVLKEEALSWLI